MSIQELIDAARQKVVSPQDIAALQHQIQEAEIEFEEQARARFVSHDLLLQAYSL